MKKIMIIGFGAMAQEVISRLPKDISVAWVVAHKPYHQAIFRALGRNVKSIEHPSACDGKPDLVLECASQNAIHEFGEFILSQGWKLAIISTGALADESLQQRLQVAERNFQGELIILSGAVAGMDGLASAREGGLDNVTYISNKSPASWRGSPAEKLVDLDTITQPVVFFEGSARDAAQQFPANANVAATIAFMGIGMDKTKVKLRVDPDTSRNTHSIYAVGTFGELHIELNGNPLLANPKTSLLAALSVVQACRRLVGSGLVA